MRGSRAVRTAVAGMALALLVGVVAAPVAMAGDAGCGLPAARVLFRGHGDLVVQGPGFHPGAGPVYGCRSAAGQFRVQIDPGNPGDDMAGLQTVGPFAARGTTVAVGLIYGVPPGELKVVDVASGSSMSLYDAAGASRYLGDAWVASVVLGPGQELAWVAKGFLATAHGQTNSYGYQVFVHRGRRTLAVDASRRIHPRSLAIGRGGRVFWRDGGTLRAYRPR